MTRIGEISLISLFCAVLSAGTAQAAGDRSIALVLDASGSMKAAMPDGKTRIDAAKAAVVQLVTTLPPETRLAFRAYGHQSPTAKKDCKDTSLLTPFGAVSANKTVVAEQARSLQPQGYTPITHALTLAAQDLSAEEATSRVVVLVSDGKETCEADPCAAAKALAEADAKLVVHTVGIGVDTVTRGQLQCIARVARGSYYDANNSAELASVLGKAAVKEAQVEEPAKKKQVTAGVGLGVLKMRGTSLIRVINAEGKEVGLLNQTQDELRLAPGVYSAAFGKQRWTGIDIQPRQTTEIKPGYLEIKLMGDQFIDVLEPETEEQSAQIFWTEPRITLIPGQYHVKFGELSWPGMVEVKPGETTKLTAGRLNIENKMGVMFVAIKDLEGKLLIEQDVRAQSRIAVPAGRYVVEIDSRGFFKSLTDEQRRSTIDIAEGEEVAFKIE